MRHLFLLYLVFSQKILKSVLLAGTLLGCEEVDAVTLGAELALGIEQFDVNVNHLTALTHNAGTQRDMLLADYHLLLVAHIQVRGYAAGLELAEDNPARNFIYQYGLHAAVQRIAPTLELGAGVPMADNIVAILVELHLQARRIVRVAAVTVIGRLPHPRIDDLLHTPLFCHQSKCACQLIGTRGAFAAAINTIQTSNNLAGLHPANEHRNALRVALTATHKLNALNHIILQLDGDSLRADTLRGIYNLLIHIGKVYKSCDKDRNFATNGPISAQKGGDCDDNFVHL